MASARISRFPAQPASNEILFDDFRFHALLPDEDWGRLPLAIWRRFSKRLADGKTVVYVGEIDQACFSRIGWWLAEVARLIGRSVLTDAAAEGPLHLDVTGDCGDERADLAPGLAPPHGAPLRH